MRVTIVLPALVSNENRKSNDVVSDVEEVEHVAPLGKVSTRAPKTIDFQQFYDREYRPLVGLAYVLSGDWALAEDLTQDAMVEVHRRWDRVSTLDNPGAWVRRVLVNKHRSKLRRLATETKALVGLGNQVEGVAVQPELDEVFSLVRKLPTRQAQAVTLRYWDDLSVAQIASVLDCGTESVRTHLKRGRASLRQLLNDDGHPLGTVRDGEEFAAAVGDLSGESFEHALDQAHGRHPQSPDPSPMPSVLGRVAVVMLLLLAAWGLVRALDDPTLQTDTIDEPQPDGQLIDEGEDEQGAGELDNLEPFTVSGGAESAVVPLNDGVTNWNADASLMLLYRSGYGHLVVDAKSGEVVADDLKLEALDIEYVLWHPTEPRQLLVLERDAIVTRDAMTGSPIARLEIDGCDRYLKPNHSSSMVNGSGMIGLRCESGETIELIVADLDSGQVLASRPAIEGFVGPVPSPSGQYFLVRGVDSQVVVFDTDFVERFRFTWSQAIVFTEVDGRELVVGPNYSGTDGTPTGSLLTVDLASGDYSTIIGPSAGEPRVLPGLVAAASPNGVVAIGAGEAQDGDWYEGPLTPGWLHVIDLNTNEPVPLALAERNATDSAELSAWIRWQIGIDADAKRITFAQGLGNRIETTVLPID